MNHLFSDLPIQIEWCSFMLVMTFTIYTQFRDFPLWKKTSRGYIGYIIEQHLGPWRPPCDLSCPWKSWDNWRPLNLMSWYCHDRWFVMVLLVLYYFIAFMHGIYRTLRSSNMACWKIHYWVRWCSVGNPKKKSSGFPSATFDYRRVAGAVTFHTVSVNPK